MALIHSVNSACPCPICLVPNAKLSDLGKHWELRTKESMQEVYKKAQTFVTETKEALLQLYGLCDIEVMLLIFQIFSTLKP